MNSIILKSPKRIKIYPNQSVQEQRNNCFDPIRFPGVPVAISLADLAQSQDFFHPGRDVGQFLFPAPGDFAGGPAVIANLTESFEHFGLIFVTLADRAPAFRIAIPFEVELHQPFAELPNPLGG